MKVEKFEDLVAWQKARALTKQIYEITKQGSFSKDYGLCDQIRRATVSVMSNLAEGFERGSSSEFHQFIVIAKASCAEARSQLYVAYDVAHITQNQFDDATKLAEEVSPIIGGLKTAIGKHKNNK